VIALLFAWAATLRAADKPAGKPYLYKHSAGQIMTGGCFCCRFNSLLEAAVALGREQAADILLAEPVGIGHGMASAGRRC
jgi:hypothetical protein